MSSNPLTAKDFYKTDHASQYPEGTTKVYSNFTPRSSRLAKVIREIYDEKIVWFGLQAFMKDFLVDEFNREFFNKPKATAVARYKRRLDTALGPDSVDVSNIEALHDLGYLPLEIKSLPEGARVNIKVPTFTITNTRAQEYWLPNALETVMSCELWGPTTSATIAYEYFKILNYYAEVTGAPKEFVPIQGHDFSMRGMYGRAAAKVSGMAHLAVGFVGTDSIPAIDGLEEWYNADAEKELIGCSVPATEHSVMCMGGVDDERGTFRRLFTELYPTGVVSIVSDTWDYWKVITEYLPEFKDEIMARQPNAIGLNKVVIRPDSGDPVRIIAGYRKNEVFVYHNSDNTRSYYVGKSVHWDDGTEPDLTNAVELSEAEVKGSIQCMWETFGGTETEKGFKVLDEHIGLIYGDSITLERANEILRRLADKGFASCNVVLGIGSYTYQFNTRDSFGWAMKATYGEVNGEGREIFKDPATDKGTKKSARGLLRVELEGDDYVLYDQQTPEQEKQGDLQPVFRNGFLIAETSLAEIRNRLAI